MKYKCLW